MAASYLRRDMTGPATFSLFVRNLPPHRGFLVAAGLEACLDALETFSFDEDELGYLRTIGFDEQDIEAFRGVRFDGEVWAVPEGRIVHAGEPIMEITASLPAAQLVETLLLNQVTLHTTVATKAARYRLAAPGTDLVDFAFRRTHGRGGGHGGRARQRDRGVRCHVERRGGAPVRARGRRHDGALVHRGVPVGESTRSARSRRIIPSAPRSSSTRTTRCSGVANAIEVVREMRLTGRLGVRLDSGDLLHLSRAARKLLDEAGLTQVRIFASGGLDELEVQELVRDGAPRRRVRHRDADGRVGRRAVRGLGLQARRHRRTPGAQALGGQGDGARAQAGVARASTATCSRSATSRAVTGAEPLLEPVMRDGVRTGSAPSLDEMRARFDADLAALPAAGPAACATPSRSRSAIRMRCVALTTLHARRGAAALRRRRRLALRRSAARTGAAPRTRRSRPALRSVRPMSSRPSSSRHAREVLDVERLVEARRA